MRAGSRRVNQGITPPTHHAQVPKDSFPPISKSWGIRPHKAKTRTERIIPVSTRLAATLEMRRVRRDGKEHPPEAYVFGDETWQRIKSVKTA